MNHPLMEFLLPMTQRQIIDRAARRIPKDNRSAFLKHVADQLRPLRDPPDDNTVRHACGHGFTKYGRRI